MKIGFIHDHKFIKKGTSYYTTGGLNKDVWSVYLTKDIECLNVFGRRCLDDSITSSLSSAPRVDFYLSTTYFTPHDYFLKYKRVKQEVTEFIKPLDGVIIRLPSFLGLIAVKVCKQLGKNYAVEVVGHAYDAISNYGSIPGKLLARYIHGLNRKAILKAPSAIYVTTSFLQQAYPCTNLISNASDVNLFKDETFCITDRISKIEKRDSCKLVVGQIGNIEVLYKGYETGLKALSLLKERVPNLNIIYYIAGSGSSMKLDIIADKYPTIQIFYLGKLDKKQILSFLDSLDIYIHPSYLEGLSRSVIESISRGCPSLTSNVGGTSELIHKDLMHNPGDYEKLYEDLYRMINDKELMKCVAYENFNHSRQYLNVYQNKKRISFWTDFYKSIIQ